MHLEIQLFEKPGTGWNRIAVCHSFKAYPYLKLHMLVIFVGIMGGIPGLMALVVQQFGWPAQGQ
jgi:hypothetical protein